MFFFVPEDRDAQILGYVVISVSCLDDFSVLIDGSGFGIDHRLDDSGHVRLVLRWLGLLT